MVDAVNECNLRCRYCHPGEVWRKQQLPVSAIREAMGSAEVGGVLEVVLTGGEITLHAELPAILEATHALRRCASTMITNATLLTPEIVAGIASSNLTRVCTSVDGVTNDLHGSARGKNLPKVLEGLGKLAATGKPITVITVVHQGNWERMIELSEYLAEHRLAVQHHLCAPSFSGHARTQYPKLALRLAEFLAVQRLVDARHRQLADAGLYLTFNSFWPATGLPTLKVNPSRSITLQQLSEQVKDTLCNIRPNGEFRLQAATWGREMVGNAILGSVGQQPVSTLLRSAEILLAAGRARQLPRPFEARHKFQLGPEANPSATDNLIGRANGPVPDIELIPISSVDEHWLMNNPVYLAAVANSMRARPDAYRVVQHPTGIVIVFDRLWSLVTLLRSFEWQAVAEHLRVTEVQS
ncbi:radical SAM protein [Nocardia terpenica]|uniref:radical SAM protein n=1 Tax=Nocardia terpenica TaxID=455432 RepID=UPI0012FDB53D|nr:radical SAM protein [Nocardia terpenica]